MKTKLFLSFILACSFIFYMFTPAIYAQDSEMAWYIKRNGNMQPTLSKEQEIIKSYNAYYLDYSLNDSSDSKKIYLTYDAGYENGNIEKTLDILKKENISAAFFVLDNIILKNTELVTRMAEEGHLVCNHTKNHKNLSLCSEFEIENNLTALEMIYEQKTGKTMSKYFRFPEGRYSINALSCISSMGYKTIFWSFAYDDWDNNKQPNCEKAIKKVLSNTHNGAIFLFHPTSDTNVKILPRLIEEWKKAGYTFGTLDEL